jgi:hypothetical protein
MMILKHPLWFYSCTSVRVPSLSAARGSHLAKNEKNQDFSKNNKLQMNFSNFFNPYHNDTICSSCGTILIYDEIYRSSFMFNSEIFCKNCTRPYYDTEEYYQNILETIEGGLCRDLAKIVVEYSKTNLEFRNGYWEFLCRICGKNSMGKFYRDNIECCEECSRKGLLETPYHFYRLEQHEDGKTWAKIFYPVCSCGEPCKMVETKCERCLDEEAIQKNKDKADRISQYLLNERCGKITFGSHAVSWDNKCRHCDSEIQYYYKFEVGRHISKYDIEKILDICKFRRCEECSPNNRWSKYIYTGNGMWKLHRVYTLCDERHSWKSIETRRKGKKIHEFEGYDKIKQRCTCDRCSKFRDHIKTDIVS